MKKSDQEIDNYNFSKVFTLNTDVDRSVGNTA